MVTSRFYQRRKDQDLLLGIFFILCCVEHFLNIKEITSVFFIRDAEFFNVQTKFILYRKKKKKKWPVLLILLPHTTINDILSTFESREVQIPIVTFSIKTFKSPTPLPLLSDQISFQKKKKILSDHQTLTFSLVAFYMIFIVIKFALL